VVELRRGAAATSNSPVDGVGYDYVRCAIDDHTRLASAEIHTPGQHG